MSDDRVPTIRAKPVDIKNPKSLERLSKMLYGMVYPALGWWKPEPHDKYH